MTLLATLILALSWTTVAQPKGRGNGPVTCAKAGEGKNMAVLFAGYTGTDKAVKGWAQGLVGARAFDGLDIGLVYAVPGPKNSGYPLGQREVPTAKLVEDIVQRAEENKPGLILVAAHSSGAFVADLMIAQLAKANPDLLGSVAFFKLDGGWKPDLTVDMGKKLGAFFCVAARCGRVSSQNAGGMSSCKNRWKNAKLITVQVPKAGCTAGWCCHDAVITTRPHKPHTYDVFNDYTDFKNRPVTTDWIKQAKPALQKLASQ